MNSISCPVCKSLFSVVTVGVDLVSTFNGGAPYRIHSGDILKCKCGIELVRYNRKAYAEHFDHNFDEKLNRLFQNPTNVYFENENGIVGDFEREIVARKDD